MRVGSLFSGVGGSALGFHNAGFKSEWFVEYEPYAQEILRKRFPEAVIYGDITKIDFRKVSGIDILEGGFPCQDISNAGKRAGIEGSRSSLWKYYLEAIRILRPKYAFIENVSALTNRGLDVVLADLASIGYDAEWHCISASSVGAPHRRDRIFILAYPNMCGFIHRESEEQSAERREQAFSKFKSGSEDVENSCSNGMYERNRKENNRREERTEHTNFTFSAGRWAVEPELGRVADGVPNRVDRIRCLGNAVVPQCAEVFAKAIKEKIMKSEE